MSFLTILLLIAMLTFVLLVVDAIYTYSYYGFGFGFSANRVAPKPRGRLGVRIQRTFLNQVENCAWAVPILTVAAISGLDSNLALNAGVVYIVARVVYAVLYYAGVSMIRSMTWGIANFSIITIGIVLVASGTVALR